MHLRKTVGSRYHPKNHKTLRIGTLFGFRALENAEARDEMEGKTSVKFSKEEPVHMTLLLFSLLTGFDPVMKNIQKHLPKEYIGSLGQTIIESQGFGIEMPGEKAPNPYDTMVRAVGDAEFKFEHSNCFVFCMSADDGSLKDQKHLGDAKWTVSAENIERFATEVAKAISVVFPPARAFPFVAAGTTWDTPNFGMQTWHGPVKYRERKVDVTSKQVHVLESLLYANSSHIKEPEFSGETEYRFVFRPCMKKGDKIVIPKIPLVLDVPFSGLMDVIGLK
jgi:hypothetical protein